MIAHRTDANQTAVASAFRQLGAFVFSLHAVGKGCPDLLCCRHGVWFPVECKTPTGKLTPAQVKFIGEAGLSGGKVYVVRSMEDVVRVCEAVEKEGR